MKLPRRQFLRLATGAAALPSAGIGSAGHVAGELFKMKTGVNLTHVPYRGLAPALTDLIGGQVHICFANLRGSIEHVRAGRLRALAVTTATRSEALPDIPTVNEFVPDYEASSTFGLGAPRNTPIDIIDRLNREINAGLADPQMKARLDELGIIQVTGTPAEFGARIAEETEKWAKVVKFAGMKPD